MYIYIVDGNTCFKKTHYLFFLLFAAQEMVEKDFSLLIGLSVALTVFLVVSLTSIRILRRKGRSPSMYTMTNLSKQLFPPDPISHTTTLKRP